MQRLLKNDNFKPLMLALIMLGIVALALGLYRFIDLSQQLQNNLAYQLQSGGGQSMNIQTQADAQMLIGASVQMQRLTGQRSEAVVLIGAGVALIALGWLGYDLARGWLRRQAPA